MILKENLSLRHNFAQHSKQLRLLFFHVELRVPLNGPRIQIINHFFHHDIAAASTLLACIMQSLPLTFAHWAQHGLWQLNFAPEALVLDRLDREAFVRIQSKAVIAFVAFLELKKHVAFSTLVKLFFAEDSIPVVVITGAIVHPLTVLNFFRLHN